MKERGKELWLFTVKNAWACLYGVLLLVAIFGTEFVTVPFISRYDFIFLWAVLIQIVLISTKLESWKEVRVIFIFHIVATIMELFKTHPGIGSWSYPHVHEAFFAVATVPLFTGFLYSAVGSYISRAIRILNLHYINYPRQLYVVLIALAIYINFFTHHFIMDARYIIFAAILIAFWKTKVEFTVYKKVRRMHFIVTGVLAAFFIWLAENIASYANVWLYPDQVEYWKLVSPEKLGSWFLLLIVSFLLVSLVYKERLKPNGE